MITRVAEDQWHASDGDLVVGSGDTGRRPDGRLYISIDAWHDTAFDRLAAAMLAELPAPLYTLVDADDADTISNWRRAGFTPHRSERQYLLVPGEAQPAVSPPAGVTLTGGAEESRAEVEGVEVGVIRISPSMRDNGRPRIARIRSIEVRADQRRRGIGRALLVHALDALHTREFGLATIDVDETDTATISLLESVGARRESNTLELTWQK
ncbi:GNAT family N-acetyltransferase [Streptomyces rubradiris]|uniref:GNAT family N-acetyltransferase n=1 Tax=Streptomyces rubradiris TaxID=285531 RepID=UPI001E456F91|nr:GNAT family N-acetyltransferase [Streptomyces rubradiris]